MPKMHQGHEIDIRKDLIVQTSTFCQGEGNDGSKRGVDDVLLTNHMLGGDIIGSGENRVDPLILVHNPTNSTQQLQGIESSKVEGQVHEVGLVSTNNSTTRAFDLGDGALLESMNLHQPLRVGFFAGDQGKGSAFQMQK